MKMAIQHEYKPLFLGGPISDNQIRQSSNLNGKKENGYIDNIKMYLSE